MGKRYTASELDARLKFGVGLTLAAVLFTTTIAILYALVFVTQPLGDQAENDKMFFSVLSSIATFITGTLAGLMIGQNRAAVDSDPAPAPTLDSDTDDPFFEEGEEQQ